MASLMTLEGQKVAVALTGNGNCGCSRRDHIDDAPYPPRAILGRNRRTQRTFSPAHTLPKKRQLPRGLM